jgi:hypothetical protein
LTTYLSAAVTKADNTNEMVLPASFNCQRTTTVPLKVEILECSYIYTDCLPDKHPCSTHHQRTAWHQLSESLVVKAYNLCLKLTIGCIAALHTLFETTGTSTSRSLFDVRPNEVVPQPMKLLISFYSD